MNNEPQTLTYRSIFRFWAPLSATWLMMSVEGPFIAALAARLPHPKENLAAWGVAFAVAIIVEAPIIMILSASTALVKDSQSFHRLRRFTLFLNLSLTAILALLVLSGAFYHVARHVIQLSELVARLTETALLILLPWPGMIGLRRFYQGVLIRAGLTRFVAYGTLVRLAGVGITGFTLFAFSDLPGAYLGGASASVAVTAEALVTRWLARASVRRLHAEPPSVEPAPSYLDIARFYWPLALTSTVSLAIHPMISFFVGRGRLPLESLAVIPVVNGLSFIFRSFGLSYQEVAITLIGQSPRNYPKVRNFAAVLGVAASAGLIVIATTPLSQLWFERISALPPKLADFASKVTLIIAVFPGLSVLMSFQRALLVTTKDTKPVTFATFIEVFLIVVVLTVGIEVMGGVGAFVAMAGLLIGRAAGNVYLLPPTLRAARRPSINSAINQA